MAKDKSKTSYFHDPQWHEEHGMGSSPKAMKSAKSSALKNKKEKVAGKMKKRDSFDYGMTGTLDKKAVKRRLKEVGEKGYLT